MTPDNGLAAVMAAMRDDPGFQIPPDAGDSILGTYGLGNWLVTWLLNRAPEVLQLTPAEFKRGMTPPRCPLDSYRPMVLRIADAEGRMPKRLVWRCYHGAIPSERDGKVVWGEPVVHQKEIDIKMPRPNVRMSDVLAATRRGATIDFQRPNPYAEHEVIIVEPKRKARKERKNA